MNRVPPPRFSPRAVFLIVAVAMLFGFSERALSSFESKVFPAPIVAPVSGRDLPDPDPDTSGRGTPLKGPVASGEASRSPIPMQADKMHD